MAVVRSRGIRHAGMSRMVQQQTPVGTHWKYSLAEAEERYYAMLDQQQMAA